MAGVPVNARGGLPGAVFRRARFTTAIEHAIRGRVFNRLCDPESKLGVLRWLQTVSMSGIKAGMLTHQHLLRNMDVLMDYQPAVDDCVAQLLRPLIDEDFSVVFYDLTTIRAASLSQEDGDLRHFGMSKEGVIARQFMLGVVQTADGMPIFHAVFDGNTAEAPTLQPTLKKVLARYPHIRRLVVADRGLLSLANIEVLAKLQVLGQRPLEFILAVPGRRYAEFVDLLQPMAVQAAQAGEEIVAETTRQPPPGGGAQPRASGRADGGSAGTHPGLAAARQPTGRQARRPGQRQGAARATIVRLRRQGALLPRGQRRAPGTHHPGRPEQALGDGARGPLKKRTRVSASIFNLSSSRLSPGSIGSNSSLAQFAVIAALHVLGAREGTARRVQCDDPQAPGLSGSGLTTYVSSNKASPFISLPK